MIIETHIVKNSLSLATRRTRIYTGTKWSAVVSRYGALDKVHWVVYSGNLAVCSGRNFFFIDAVTSAIKCLSEKLSDKWWSDA